MQPILSDICGTIYVQQARGGDGQRRAVTGRHKAAEPATMPTSLGEKHDPLSASIVWGRNIIGRTVAR